MANAPKGTDDPMTTSTPESTITHESFKAIANETRLSILHALWTEGASTFIELFDAVAVDDTGQFTYHLNQLLDQFAFKADDRYKLTNAGREIVTTVLANVDGDNPLASPHALDIACHACGEPIHAQSRGDWLNIDCSTCDKLYASYPVPRAGLHHRTADEFLRTVDQRLRHMNALVHRDICPNCSCEMERVVIPDAEPEPGLPFVLFHRCSHCGMALYTLPATGLLEHPRIIAFYEARGVDLFGVLQWSIDWLYSGDRIDVVEESPLEYTIDIRLDGDELRATLDDEGTVRDIQTVDR